MATYYGKKKYQHIAGSINNLVSTGLIPQFYAEMKTATVSSYQCHVYRLLPNYDLALIVSNNPYLQFGIGSYQSPSMWTGINNLGNSFSNDSGSYMLWYYNTDGIFSFAYRHGYGDYLEVYFYIDYSEFSTNKIVKIKVSNSGFSFFNSSFTTLYYDTLTNTFIIDSDYILTSLSVTPNLKYMAANGVSSISCTPIAQSRFNAPMKMPIIKHFIGNYVSGQEVGGYFILSTAGSRLPTTYDVPALSEYVGFKI